MNENHKNHPDQNRKVSDQENMNAGVNYKNDQDIPDSGFAKTDEIAEQRIAKAIGVDRKEVGRMKDTGALSGRQDYAGGFAGDKTATIGTKKGMEDKVSDPHSRGEGSEENRGKRNDHSTKK